MPNYVGDLGKIIVVLGFKKLPKVQKSPNLVTLEPSQKVELSEKESMIECVT